jgi:hypothetical protein
VPGGQVLQLRARGQRLLERARERLVVGPVVEHQQLPVDVAERLGESQDLVVAVPRRDVPVEGEAVGQPRQVVDPGLGHRVLGEQFHGADRVLECQRQVAELLDDRRQDEVAARQEVRRVVIGGPALDLLGPAAGLGDVPAPPEQVGLYQTGAQCQVGEAEIVSSDHRLLRAPVHVVPVEPREVLQLTDGLGQRTGAGVVDDQCGRSVAASPTGSFTDVRGRGHRRASASPGRSLSACHP